MTSAAEVALIELAALDLLHPVGSVPTEPCPPSHGAAIQRVQHSLLDTFGPDVVGMVGMMVGLLGVQPSAIAAAIREDVATGVIVPLM